MANVVEPPVDSQEDENAERIWAAFGRDVAKEAGNVEPNRAYRGSK